MTSIHHKKKFRVSINSQNRIRGNTSSYIINLPPHVKYIKSIKFLYFSGLPSSLLDPPLNEPDPFGGSSDITLPAPTSGTPGVLVDNGTNIISSLGNPDEIITNVGGLPTWTNINNLIDVGPYYPYAWIPLAQSGTPYSTFNDALNAAIALPRGVANWVVLEIFPGQYTLDNTLGPVTIPSYIAITGNIKSNGGQCTLRALSDTQDVIAMDFLSNYFGFGIRGGRYQIINNDMSAATGSGFRLQNMYFEGGERAVSISQPVYFFYLDFINAASGYDILLYFSNLQAKAQITNVIWTNERITGTFMYFGGNNAVDSLYYVSEPKLTGGLRAFETSGNPNITLIGGQIGNTLEYVRNSVNGNLLINSTTFADPDGVALSPNIINEGTLELQNVRTLDYNDIANTGSLRYEISDSTHAKVIEGNFRINPGYNIDLPVASLNPNYIQGGTVGQFLLTDNTNTPFWSRFPVYTVLKTNSHNVLNVDSLVPWDPSPIFDHNLITQPTTATFTIPANSSWRFTFNSQLTGATVNGEDIILTLYNETDNLPIYQRTQSVFTNLDMQLGLIGGFSTTNQIDVSMRVRMVAGQCVLNAAFSGTPVQSFFELLRI